MKVLKRVTNVFLILFDSIIVIVLIAVISNFIQTKILQKKYANFFGYSMFQIKTGSMAGTIEINDAVLVKNTQNVNIDEIIVFLEDKSIITHRLIKEENNEYITKGDANTSEDNPIQKSQVIGKVVKILPRFGIWMKVLTDKSVIICIIMTLVFLGFTLSVKEEKISRRGRRRRKPTNEKKEKEE